MTAAPNLMRDGKDFADIFDVRRSASAFDVREHMGIRAALSHLRRLAHDPDCLVGELAESPLLPFILEQTLPIPGQWTTALADSMRGNLVLFDACIALGCKTERATLTDEDRLVIEAHFERVLPMLDRSAWRQGSGANRRVRASTPVAPPNWEDKVGSFINSTPVLNWKAFQVAAGVVVTVSILGTLGFSPMASLRLSSPSPAAQSKAASAPTPASLPAPVVKAQAPLPSASLPASSDSGDVSRPDNPLPGERANPEFVPAGQ